MSPPPPRVRTAVLISGRGSNMQALVEAAEAADFPAQIVLVLSNRADAAGISWAQARGVATAVVESRAFGPDRAAHETAMQAELERHGVELVALAGYMRVLTGDFVRRWAGRMINIHPSLLPRHPGLDTHARALAAGDAEAGCSVHWVTEGVDEGPVLGQARTAVRLGDTADSLAARVLGLEHRLYPAMLAEAARQVRAEAAPQP